MSAYSNDKRVVINGRTRLFGTADEGIAVVIGSPQVTA